MKRFVSGADRGQTTLLPECLDDFIDESNPVRLIDAFVEALDLADLGFAGVAPAATGRPAYHPATLLKLYIYGYLNRVQSSRQLEREAGRNLEVMWLLGRLLPDHKTIADFRKDNGPGIRKVCARFVALCREMGLLTKGSVAIDGSKFEAVNNRDRYFTRAKVERRMGARGTNPESEKNASGRLPWRSPCVVARPRLPTARYRNQDPQRKFGLRTPLTVGTLAMSGTTGRRMVANAARFPVHYGDNPACSPIPLARAMRSASFQTGINHFRRGKCVP
jgi:transposase